PQSGSEIQTINSIRPSAVADTAEHVQVRRGLSESITGNVCRIGTGAGPRPSCPIATAIAALPNFVEELERLPNKAAHTPDRARSIKPGLVRLAIWRRQSWRRSIPRSGRPSGKIEFVDKICRIEEIAAAGVTTQRIQFV